MHDVHVSQATHNVNQKLNWRTVFKGKYYTETE